MPLFSLFARSFGVMSSISLFHVDKRRENPSGKANSCKRAFNSGPILPNRFPAPAGQTTLRQGLKLGTPEGKEADPGTKMGVFGRVSPYLPVLRECMSTENSLVTAPSTQVLSGRRRSISLSISSAHRRASEIAQMVAGTLVPASYCPQFPRRKDRGGDQEHALAFPTLGVRNSALLCSKPCGRVFVVLDSRHLIKVCNIAQMLVLGPWYAGVLWRRRIIGTKR